MKSLKTRTTACMILNRRIIFVVLAMFVAVLLSSCADGNAKIASRQGYERFPEDSQTPQKGKKGKKTAPIGKVMKGQASYYGPGFDGKKTASGEIFNQNAMTCAHKTLPFGTKLRVVRDDTGASVEVRVNDRGPFVRDRIIDLSAAAGKKLGLDKVGYAKVTATVIE